MWIIREVGHPMGIFDVPQWIAEVELQFGTAREARQDEIPVEQPSEVNEVTDEVVNDELPLDTERVEEANGPVNTPDNSGQSQTSITNRNRRRK